VSSGPVEACTKLALGKSRRAAWRRTIQKLAGFRERRHARKIASPRGRLAEEQAKQPFSKPSPKGDGLSAGGAKAEAVLGIVPWGAARRHDNSAIRKPFPPQRPVLIARVAVRPLSTGRVCPRSPFCAVLNLRLPSAGLRFSRARLGSLLQANRVWGCEKMPIYRLLKDSPFGPDEIAVLADAYERTLRKLNLVDRNDPITEMVARKVIELGQRGVREAQRLSDLALKELGVE